MAVVGSVPLHFAGLTLDPAARTLVDAGGEFISLRRSELELLLAFVNNPGRALSRDYLLTAVAGRHSDSFDRSIDVLVGRLRRKIEPEPGRPRLILTVPGIGYLFAVRPSPVVLPVEEHDEAGLRTATPAPRLSIVVLPFTNLSKDREQQYFADGITDDLTTDLSRLEHMLVISRNTAFTYQNKRVDTKQIGRELGVRYVLQGSFRRSGNHARVNVQLIDAETDAHLWAERFDSDAGDLFAVQNEITSRIAVALDLEVIDAEAARPNEHPDALDYILRGRAITAKPRTPDNWAEMISLFERAVALDPRSVDAQSWLATALTSRTLDQMADSAPADIACAEGLADQALAASPRSLFGHYAKAQVLRAQGRYKEAIPEYETAITINRNWVGAIAHLGRCKLFTGSIEETIPLVEKAIRLSPRDGQIANWYWRIGVVHLLQSRMRRSGGLRRRAMPIRDIPYLTFFLLLHTHSKARPNPLPPNSPKPGG
jgi:TolB-like protein